MVLFNLRHPGRPQYHLPKTNVDRIRYLGDPISMPDFNSTTIMPSFKQGWKIVRIVMQAWKYVADKVPLHDTMKNPLSQSGKDEDATIITE